MLSVGSGRENEAAALVDQVRKTSPVDQGLITTLSQALDMLGKGYRKSNCVLTGLGDEIVNLYEEALKKKPKDEEFARHWFQQMVQKTNIDGARKARVRCEAN